MPHARAAVENLGPAGTDGTEGPAGAIGTIRAAFSLRVAVVEDGSNRELAAYTGAFTNSLRRFRFATLDAKGHKARIRIIDKAKGPWGHITFGGLYKEAPALFVR